MHLLLQNLDLKKFLQGLARLSSGLTKIKFCMLKSHKIFCVCARTFFLKDLLKLISKTYWELIQKSYKFCLFLLFICFSKILLTGSFQNPSQMFKHYRLFCNNCSCKIFTKYSIHFCFCNCKILFQSVVRFLIWLTDIEISEELYEIVTRP